MIAGVIRDDGTSQPGTVVQLGEEYIIAGVFRDDGTFQHVTVLCREIPEGETECVVPEDRMSQPGTVICDGATGGGECMCGP